MSWCKHAVDELQAGRQVRVCPHGRSMQPKIVSGADVLLEPVTEATGLSRGDAVLARVRGRYYLHLISAVDSGGARFQIANARGRVNGWVGRGSIFGRAIEIDNRPREQRRRS